MKTKISKAQAYIWEAKERLSAELLKLPANKRTAYIIKHTKSTVEAIKKNGKQAKV
jgi:hypothetical protein